MTIQIDRTKLVAHLHGLAVAGYPVIAVPTDILGLPSRPVSIALRLFMALMAFFIVYVALKQKAYYKGKFWQVFALFVILLTMRLVWDILIVHVHGLYYKPAEYFADLFIISLAPAIGTFAIPNLDRPFIKIPFIYAGLGCVLQFASNTVLHRPTYIGRMNSDVFDSISLGHLGASTCLMAAWILLAKKHDHQISRRLAGFGLFISLLVVFTAASRGPLVSMGASALLFTLFWFRGRARMLGVTYLAGFLVMLVGFAFVAEDVLGYKMMERISGQANGEETVEARKSYTKTAFRDYKEFPVAGKSITLVKDEMYPHNLFIEAFMATGTVGGLLFLLMTAWALLSSVRLLMIDSHHAWVGLLCVQRMVGALFSGNLVLWPHMYVLISATIALWYFEQRRLKPATVLALGAPIQA